MRVETCCKSTVDYMLCRKNAPWEQESVLGGYGQKFPAMLFDETVQVVPVCKRRKEKERISYFALDKLKMNLN